MQGTSVEPVYQAIRTRVRIWTLPLTPRMYQTPVGEIRLMVSNDSFLAEKTDTGGHEAALVRDMGRWFDPDTVFYDVGSHFGYMTKVALAAGVPEDGIHAFEAERFRFHVLSRNHEDEALHLNRVYVSDAVGAGQITIDSYARSNPPPDVVKIDIEGAEYAAIQGMEETIGSSKPRLYVEVHPHYLGDFGATVNDVMELLTGHSYTVEMLTSDSTDGEWVEATAAVLPTDRAYTLRAR